MTGMNPGKHGVYGFTRLEPSKGYTIKVNSGAIRRAQTIWQLLTNQGLRSIVLNVPMTYPPDSINGLVITGIDTPGLESEFTYPPDFRQELFEYFPDYTLDVRSWGVTAVGERRAHILDDILQMVKSRKELALHLMMTQPWDVFTIVFTATDRAQHFFWRFLDPSHPLYDAAETAEYHDAILKVYQRVDEALGEMMTVCDEDTTVIVMSDHGFGPQRKLFRINQWLVENDFLQLTYKNSDGFLQRLSGQTQEWLYRKMDGVVRLIRTTVSDTTKDRLKRLFPRLREQVASQILFSGVDWSQTLAYHTAEFPGSIRINLSGREVNGCVAPGAEYDAVCEAIQSKLEAYTDPTTSKKLVERVFRREEVYWGPYVETAPDLIVHLADYAYTIDWYVPVSRDGTRQDLPIIDALTGRYAVNCGSHRLDGILMLHGPDIRSDVQLHSNQIYDIAPTLLYLLEQPIPADMDGRVLTEAFVVDRLDRQLLKRDDLFSQLQLEDSHALEHAYSAEESEVLAARLRSLGYL
jgi:predicted AlkP superfamily phosphohydrolase/phosphomutase